jgi:hypothetical protein
MERLRTPRPSGEFTVDSVHPLPATPSLPALLAAVSSPGVLQEEVDALLRGLASPLAPDEAPRARADFLLSLLESREVVALQGSDGRTVRLAAVEALLALGYPYALEVPPEALEEAHRARKDATPRDIPGLGIAAAVLALMVQSVVTLPAAIDFLSGRPSNIPFGLFILGATWGPSLSALLGGWLRLRGLQRLGIATMALMGTAWLSLFALQVSPSLHDIPTTVFLLLSGLSLVTGAILLRSPEWLAKKEPPASTPPAQDASTPPGR